MIWMRQHPALVSLVSLIVILGLLFATGKLQIRWSESRPQREREDKDEPVGGQKQRAAGDTVTIDRSTFEVSKLKVATVSKASLPVIFQTPGEVQLSPDRIARVTPQLAGIVSSVLKNIGDPVAKGETLCLIESAELGDARASYLAALSDHDFAERNYQRWKLLFEKGLRTQNELYAAETDFTRAKVKLESAEARLRALGFGREEIVELHQERSQAVSNRYSLRSPISGTVLERSVTVGQNIDAKDQIFFVGDLSTVWVQGVAHEVDLSQLHPGLPALVRIQASPNVSFPGKVAYLGEQLDEKTRTIPIRVVVRNSQHPTNTSQLLRPGLFTTVEVQLTSRRDVVAVPESALQSESDRSYVFVEAQPPGGNSKNSRDYSFQRRPVQLGAHADGLVEITGGLAPGERIVVQNAFLLAAEMEKSNVEE
jgi:membrane fusion protein, heavy metal efflux system